MLRRKGFTLVELMITIAIICILATIITISYLAAKERSMTSKAKGDISNISSAALLLLNNTHELPFHYNSDCSADCSSGGCTADGDNEYVVTDSRSGLSTNDGAYTGWFGPYLTIGKDPWGNDYRFDPDYYCGFNGSSTLNGWEVGSNEKDACVGISKGVMVRGFMSYGPNGKGKTTEELETATKALNHQYGGDNIFGLMCKIK